jgi:hypothetical protein
MSIQEERMIIQTREFGYGENYGEFFEGLKKWKAAVEQKYPEVNITLMYNLAVERGRLTVQSFYSTLADYERIDAALDNDEEIGSMMNGMNEYLMPPIKDQTYRVIS